MSNRSVMVTLRANVADFTSNMRQASSSLEDLVKKGDATGKVAETGLGRMAQSMQLQRAEWDQLGNTMLGVGTAGTLAFGGMAKSAIDYESAFAGVKKTVDGTPEQIDALNTSIRNMAREMPASHAEIAGVAEAAGQLGIEIPNIEGFTRSMVALGSSTNMSADEAATSLARFANIMGTSQTEFSNLGSSIVALGNNFATTESEITHMAQRLASAGNQIGLTEGDVLGIATALSSVGIEAEAGGTAFSTVMIEMRKAVDEGGSALDMFAQTAGMTGSQFQKAFKEDAAGAITAFIQGLAQMEASGQSIQPVLDELGLTDARVGNALRSSAAAADLFTGAIEMGNQAYQENTALMDEYSQRVGTTESQLQILKNSVVDAGISMGSIMLPAINFVVGALADFAGFIADLPTPILAVITTLGGIATAATLAGGAFFTLAPRVMDTWAAFGSLANSIPGVSRALGAISGPLSTVGKGLATVGKWAGIPAAAVATVGSLTKGFLEMVGAIDRNVTGAEELQNKLLGMSGAGTSFYDTVIKPIGDINTDQFSNLADTFDRIANVRWTDKPADWGWGWMDSTGFTEVSEQLEVLDQQITSLAQTDLSAATGQFRAMWEEAGGTEKAFSDMMKIFPGYREAMLGMANSTGRAVSESELLALMTGQLNGEMGGAAGAASTLDGNVTGVAGALDGVIGSSEAAEEHLAEMFETIANSDTSFISLIDGYNSVVEASKAWAEETAGATASSKDSWEDYYDGVSVKMDEWLAALEEQVAAQQAWEQNMLLLSGKVSQGVLDELSRLGPEGAPLVAELVDASDEELARMEELFAEGGSDAASTFADNLQNSGPVIAEVMRVAGEDAAAAAAEALASGETTLQEIIDQYDLDITLNTDEAEAGIDSVNEGLASIPSETTTNAVYETAEAVTALMGWHQNMDRTPPTTDTDAVYETASAVSSLFGWHQNMDRTPPTTDTDAVYETASAVSSLFGWHQNLDRTPKKTDTTGNYHTMVGTGNARAFQGVLGRIPKATNTNANVHDRGSGVIGAIRSGLSSLRDKTVTVTVRQAGVSLGGIAASAASLAGFATGGYTGDGGRWEPAGIVHKSEFVFSKPAVDRLGLGFLSQLHSGAIAGHAYGGPVGAVSRPAVVVPSQQARVVQQVIRVPYPARVTVVDSDQRLTGSMRVIAVEEATGVVADWEDVR
ncbi:phage tail tape measure protein [Actinomycetaceae bacterium L2_0104]